MIRNGAIQCETHVFASSNDRFLEDAMSALARKCPAGFFEAAVHARTCRFSFGNLRTAGVHATSEIESNFSAVACGRIPKL